MISHASASKLLLIWLDRPKKSEFFVMDIWKRKNNLGKDIFTIRMKAFYFAKLF